MADICHAVFLLAYYHWRESKNNIPPFQPPQIQYWKPTSGIPVNTGIADADIKKAFDDCRNGFNAYINSYNQSSSVLQYRPYRTNRNRTEPIYLQSWLL